MNIAWTYAKANSGMIFCLNHALLRENVKENGPFQL